MADAPHNRKYFHDHVVMLLLSINAFIATAGSVYILLRLANTHGNFISQCRDCSNQQAVNRFTGGAVSDILSFIAFSFLVLAVHFFISRKVYHIHRQLSITILSLGILLLSLAVIISNALLVLR